MRLHVEDLSCRVSGDFALTGINLELPPGARLALIGPNGSGKSTLLRALTGYLHATGHILLDGQALPRLSARARARALCLMPQSEESGHAFTVDEYVRLARYPHQGWTGTLRARDEDRVTWALVQAGCAAWRGRRLGTLSGGERQLVRLAAALAQEARILLLDEPAAFLDPGQRSRLWERLDRVLADERLSLVFVSHDLNEVLRRADHFLALKAGKPWRQGGTGDLVSGDWLDGLFDLPLEIVRLPGHPRPLLVERETASSGSPGGAGEGS